MAKKLDVFEVGDVVKVTCDERPMTVIRVELDEDGDAESSRAEFVYINNDGNLVGGTLPFAALRTFPLT